MRRILGLFMLFLVYSCNSSLKTPTLKDTTEIVKLAMEDHEFLSDYQGTDTLFIIKTTGIKEPIFRGVETFKISFIEDNRLNRSTLIPPKPGRHFKELQSPILFKKRFLIQLTIHSDSSELKLFNVSSNAYHNYKLRKVKDHWNVVDRQFGLY